MVIFKGRALILAKQKDFSGGEWLVQLETAPVKCSINDKILKEPSGVSNLAFLSYTIAAEVSFPLREKGNSFPLLCFSFFFIFFLSPTSTTGSALIWVSQKQIYLCNSPSVPGNEGFPLISGERNAF